ncbi:MAG: hypothetical protein K0S80_2673 [Neobacillus sp.]|nr:hypothetical protein [Neobacillus sp.]
MYEGKIIKFYREKYKLTHEQLGKDICSMFKDMTQINGELEQEELIQISEYFYMYQLLLARYLLMDNKCHEQKISLKNFRDIFSFLFSNCYFCTLSSHFLYSALH